MKVLQGKMLTNEMGFVGRCLANLPNPLSGIAYHTNACCKAKKKIL
jgi:hypothetical protein